MLTIVSMIVAVLSESDSVAAVSLIAIAAIVIDWLALVAVDTVTMRRRRK